jgi:cation:H+ antiporter
MIENVALFLFGLLVLVAGAECLIRGAVRVARALGVSPFVIGFTLVGFGTSAPELVVSLSAALQGSPDIALGNVVGSNIANIGLILAVAAILRPLAARMRLLRVEVPMTIGVSLLLWLLAWDNALTRLDGAVLLAGFLAVAHYTYRSARREPPEVKEEVGKEAAVYMPVWLAAVLVVVGLGGLIWGADLMVEAAVRIARALGVSDWLVGLTVVAVGTSLPELAASTAAAIRGDSDIALGNVLGSNIFNVLLILGVTVVVHPIHVDDTILVRELPVMVGFAILLVPIVGYKLKVHRWEGLILLGAYAAFIAWQVAGSGR